MCLSHRTALLYWRLLNRLRLPASRSTNLRNVQDARWRVRDLGGTCTGWITFLYEELVGAGLTIDPAYFPNCYIGPGGRYRWITKIDLLVSTRARCYVTMDYERHLCGMELPPRGIRQLTGNTNVTSPELTLIMMAPYMADDVELQMLCYEACGNYSLLPEGLKGRKGYGFVDRPALTTVEKCLEAANATHVNGAEDVRLALRDVTGKSFSPRESATAIMFKRPLSRGGFGFTWLQLNVAIDLSDEGAAIIGIKALRADIVIRDPRWEKGESDIKGVVIGYQGKGDHFDPVDAAAQAANDNRRRRAFEVSGYPVIHITAEEFAGLPDLTAVARQAAGYLGLDFDYDDPQFLALRTKLHQRLQDNNLGR